MSDVIEMHRSELIESIKSGELYSIIRKHFPEGACILLEGEENISGYHDEDITVKTAERYAIQISNKGIERSDKLIDFISENVKNEVYKIQIAEHRSPYYAY